MLLKIIQNDNQNSESLLLACNNVDFVDKNKWFLDTGYSNWMYKEKIFFEIDGLLKKK